ncbi:glyoxalase [Microtetraspora sp. NBRC 13810]|uniref:VOC family protein n=1 Tax=Microtetraspora sp. NBRC 13810 TaxID=3030990 RepID=UPI0024A2F604|nr:VOC family protein [Microtetraspora sp. NBRC 13810]GLW08450.1 glyoxalase [Microtetraspora sp. NBRC 13810]
MIGVGKITLNVRDQDGAKRFWIDKMGFEEVIDQPMGEDARWIEVRSTDSSIHLVLFAPVFEESKIGRLSNMIFVCDDIQRTFEELSGRGVEFVDKPSQQPWGWWASFRDNEGNLYGLSPRGE